VENEHDTAQPVISVGYVKRMNSTKPEIFYCKCVPYLRSDDNHKTALTTGQPRQDFLKEISRTAQSGSRPERADNGDGVLGEG